MKDPIKGRRYCYTAVGGEHQDPTKHGGYMPSMVVEGEQGHYPMQGGDHEFAVPWIWGKTIPEVAETCKRFNSDRLGLTEDEAWEIERSAF